MNVSSIELLILDVDGVLTDGRIITDSEGERVKRFHVQDGCAIKLWQRCSGRVALLSGRAGAALQHRAQELGIDHVYTGSSNKLETYETVLAETGFADGAVAYVGDDLPDLGPMARCAFPIAVANAVPAVKQSAACITRRPGGSGAVAEIVELLLRKQKRWSREMLSRV